MKPSQTSSKPITIALDEFADANTPMGATVATGVSTAFKIITGRGYKYDCAATRKFATNLNVPGAYRAGQITFRGVEASLVREYLSALAEKFGRQIDFRTYDEVTA